MVDGRRRVGGGGGGRRRRRRLSCVVDVFFLDDVCYVVQSNRGRLVLFSGSLGDYESVVDDVVDDFVGFRGG